MIEDDTHVIHGAQPTHPIPKGTIGEEIKNCLLHMPTGSVAMIDAFSNEKLLYSKLLQKSVDLAVVLRHHGYVGQNNVLSVSSENCLDFYIPVIASLLNGSILVPLNHCYTLYELEHTCNISKPKVVFCAAALIDKFLELKRKLKFIERIIIINEKVTNKPTTYETAQTLDDFINEILHDQNSDVESFQPVEGDGEKMAALIMCSSGTTGLPKGVVLSHQNLYVRDPEYNVTGARVNALGLIPFSHTSGLATSFPCILNGQTVISHSRFDEDVFLHSIEKYKINCLPIAPPLAIFLSKSDKVFKYNLSSIKDILCGAAPLSKDTEEEVLRRLKLKSCRQGYGLTEMTLAVTMGTLNELRPGSCGKTLPYISGKVRDPDTGNSLGPNQVGELCWRGPAMMLGYYDDKNATDDTITHDGWLKSGDLGYFDESGYLYVIDRLKELIKFKGFQVPPAELEAILINHPKIEDVGVVGLPDRMVGEKPLAFVVKKKGNDITEDEVKKYVAGLVSPQKRLTGGVIFVDAIPKNPSGKILRRELREQLKTIDPKL